MAWKKSSKSNETPITTPPGLSLVPLCKYGASAQGPESESSKSNCPPGLEYLRNVDQLIVDQKVNLFEVCTGLETENKYVVKNDRGQVVYYALENSNCCNRIFCGTLRPFEMKIVDGGMREVIQLTRPLNCSVCWFPCCLQEMDVSSNGEKLGSVLQNWNPIRPSFSICDAAGNRVLKIKGSFWTCPYPCADVVYKILSIDGEHQVGKISKTWSGLMRELFTDAYIFRISFTDDLDVKIKAVLFGACFLIDFIYFEKTHITVPTL